MNLLLARQAHGHATKERLPAANILLTLYNTQPKALKALFPKEICVALIYASGVIIFMQ